MNETRGIGAATVAFRRLLADAGGSDQARVDALVALVRHTILAVTMGADERLRTLTNPDGESAVALFTGHDVMHMAARGFGWLGPDGTLPSKELGAREALRQALAQGVQFVVLDLGAAYATEFSRREVESVLAAQKTAGVGAYAATGTASEIIRTAVRESTRPPGAAPAFLTPVPPAPPVPRLPVAEMDEPFVHTGRGASEPFPGPAPPSRSPLPPAAPPRSPVPAATPPRSSRPATPTAPTASAAPTDGGSAMSTPPHEVSAPARTPPAAAAPAATAAPEREAPVRRPAAATLFQVAPPKRTDSLPRVSFSSAPPPMSGSTPPEPAHAPPPPPTPSIPARTGSSESMPAVRPSPMPAAPATSKAPTGAPQPAASKAPTGAPQPAPSATATGAPQPAPYMRRRSTATMPKSDADAENAAKKLAEKVMRTTAEPGADRFDKPLNRLAEKSLQHIAESLRRYPEVEWACELADGQGRPLIGVRLDPAFQSRAEEISEAVLAAATDRKLTVQVALITETAKLREARSLGAMFYPWRKK